MKKNANAFQVMLAAWNERNLNQIRGHVDNAIAENVVFADPTNFIHGRDAFEEMIKEFRRKYPDSVVRRTSGIDSHNNRYRYSWDIYVGVKEIVKGFDVAQLDENGLVERIDGFFGDLPPLES
ncbi:MAG: nuclear transport factor 2 family protein [Blastocatellia bacterium]